MLLQVKACDTPPAQITHPNTEIVIESHSLHIFLYKLVLVCSFCSNSFLLFAVYLSLMSSDLTKLQSSQRWVGMEQQQQLLFTVEYCNIVHINVLQSDIISHVYHSLVLFHVHHEYHLIKHYQSKLFCDSLFNAS